MKCMYGSGCVLAAVDFEHATKCTHSGSRLPKCKQTPCLIYRRFILDDDRESARHVAMFFHDENPFKILTLCKQHMSDHETVVPKLKLSKLTNVTFSDSEKDRPSTIFERIPVGRDHLKSSASSPLSSSPQNSPSQQLSHVKLLTKKSNSDNNIQKLYIRKLSDRDKIERLEKENAEMRKELNDIKNMISMLKVQGPV